MYASFLLGVICAFAGVGWGLASRKRAQIVGRFLLRAAGPDVEVIRKRDRVSPKPAGSADADLVSALANFGASKR